MGKQSGIKSPPGGAATLGKEFVMVYPQVANFKRDLTVALAITKDGKTESLCAIIQRKRKERGM